MNYLFLLSREDRGLAKEEILAITNKNNIKIINNILILNIKNNKIINDLEKRLAYTKSIHQLIFESNKKGFLKKFEGFQWNKIYKENFSITISSLINKKNNKNILKKLSGHSEKELAKYVWNSVKKPKVKLKDSKTQINIFVAKNKIFCSLLLKDIKNTFEERKSHLRPRPSPISLHPKLARAMVNLTGAKQKDTILDPFCGSGGILLEAGLIGMKTIGYDINKKMIWKSMINLKHYKIKNHKLGIKDFFGIKRKFKYIVADLPYGLNSNINERLRVTKANRNEIKKFIDGFYTKIVKQLEKILTKKAVIIFPSYVNYKRIIRDSKLKIKKEYESYIHNNLTRKILVLSK